MRFGGGDLSGVGDLPAKRFGQPIAVGQALGVGPDGARFPTKLGGEFLLANVHQLGAAVLLVTEPKPFLGRLEQGAKQGSLPLIPDPRPNRADIHHREREQQPKPLGALHLVNEILDRFGVGEIALEGGRR